jgi:uncharacterized protein with HEPN domain
MARSEAERVRDILDAIAAIRADTDGFDQDGFAARPTVVRSVLYSIGVIGEAVKGLGPAFRAARPGVPWQAVAGLRDVVVHEYFRTNVRRVWEVVADELDVLEAALRDTPD